MTDRQVSTSFVRKPHAGLAMDPIHVGAGGARLGRVDNSIVRDPVTKVPIIPGSSLAGVLRTYVAMAQEVDRDRQTRNDPYYPNCAGQGRQREDGSGGHCGRKDCRVCMAFGFAGGKDSAGGFAGLAAFSDMHLLLFPVATREGPVWVTAPGALWLAGIDKTIEDEDCIYRKKGSGNALNLGWLLLAEKSLESSEDLEDPLKVLGVPDRILDRTVLISDKLFGHVVNSHLEVRSSVAIDSATGAAQKGALFTYEALPRTSVLYWDVICKFPGHFQIGKEDINVVRTSEEVYESVKRGHAYLEALGIGGMGTRGMGRLRVLSGRNDDKGGA